jgi:hypothetical protein
MKFRVFTLLFFLALIIGSYLYFQFEDQIVAFSSEEDQTDVQLDDETFKEEYDSWWQEKTEPLESRLEYNKKLAVVYVGELNTASLIGQPLEKVQDYKATFNKDTKSVYFYSEQYIPREEDNLLVIQDTNDYDVLLNQNIFSDESEVSFALSSLPNENNTYYIANEGRLFLDTPIEIRLLNDNGSIEVKFGSQVFTLKEGEYKVFNKEDSKEKFMVKSKILIANYGMWESNHMKYVVETGGR